MSYRGAIQPQLEWSVRGRQVLGIRGIESGFVSSSLILVATSKVDGANVTCAAALRGHSAEDTRIGVLWTSDTFRIRC